MKHLEKNRSKNYSWTSNNKPNRTMCCFMNYFAGWKFDLFYEEVIQIGP